MSDRTPPPPRRRIAGEAPVTPAVKKAAPAKKAAAKKAPAKKAAARKPAAKKAPAKKAPAKKVSLEKAPVTTTSVTAAVEASTDVAAPQVARPTLEPRTKRVAAAGPPSTSRLAIAVAAIVLVAGAAVGALGFAHWRSDDFTASRTAAVSAASSAAETIFSFSYDKLDQHTTESKALMTATYGKEFDTIVPTLTDVAPQRKVTVKAVTRNAAALPCGNECSATKASVLIFVDQDRRLADDNTSTVFGNRIVVDMVKADGDWKVSDIRAL